MKTLESLKSSKFEAFKEDRLLNAINVVGGRLYLTKKTMDGEYTDCWDDSCGRDIVTTSGKRYDACPSQQIAYSNFGEEIDIATGDTYYLAW